MHQNTSYSSQKIACVVHTAQSLNRLVMPELGFSLGNSFTHTVRIRVTVNVRISASV